ARPVATAASTALPPAARTTAPTAAARRLCAATMPPAAFTTALRGASGAGSGSGIWSSPTGFDDGSRPEGAPTRGLLGGGRLPPRRSHYSEVPQPARRMKRWLNVLVPLLLLAGAVWLRLAFGVNDLPLMRELQNLVFDNYQRAQPRPYRADLPVRIVDIDEQSLEKLGQWPWPRTLIARLVDRLADAGAAVVVFDILFPEPDRMAPANLQSMLPDLKGM